MLLKDFLTFNDKLLKRFGIVKRFALHSFILMVFIALFFFYIVFAYYSNVEHTAIHEASTAIMVQSQTLISPKLKNINIQKPFSGQELTKFNRLFKNELIKKDIVHIKIWNKNEVIVYSDENRLIGKQYKFSDHLKTALNGHMDAEIKKPDVSLAEQRELLEVYVPIYLEKEKPVAVYEVYQKPNKVALHIANKRNNSVAILFVLLIIIYLSLVWFFKSSYKKMLTQKNKLNRLNIDLKHSITSLEENYFDTIKGLMLAVDAKDHYTAGHSIRVTDMSVALAKGLKLSSAEIDTIEKAALFHDIGKIGIAGEILLKPGKLTEEEYEEIKNHPLYGAKIISAIKFLKPTVEILKHHHERYDGSGYPNGLKGKNINIGSRIIAVADTFDAITTTRPHRFARSPKEALKEIDRCSGTQFDAEVVKAFIKVIEAGNIRFDIHEVDSFINEKIKLVGI